VTFQCRVSFATPQVRLPGESAFGFNFPANLMLVGSMDEVTFTVVNAQRSENSTAFQCGGGGQFTNIGVLNVYCKLYSLDEENERGREIRACVVS